MAIKNVSPLQTNFFVNNVAVGCAQKITFAETTATGAGAAAAGVLCRADYAAQAAAGTPPTAGTWTTTTAGANSFTVDLAGLVRITSGSDVATNMTYRELTDLKDAGAPVAVRFGTGTSGESQRVGQALITSITQVSDPAQPVETFDVKLLGIGSLTWVVNP